MEPDVRNKIASRQGKNEITNAIPTFLGSSFSTELLTTLWDETGSHKYNMAAAKPEVHISQLLDEIETKLQRLPAFVGFSASMELLRKLLVEAGS